MVLLLLAATPAWAKDPGMVVGTLTVEGRRGPVAGATVRLQDVSSGRAFRLTTDGRGRFAHVGVNPGLYRLVVDEPGFAGVEVLDVDVRSNDRVRLTIELTPYDEAPFKRRTIRYQRPVIETESSTLTTRIM